MTQLHRWVVFGLPLVLPWVVVTWSEGWYVVFSAFWIDPGPRWVSIVDFLAMRGFSLPTRHVASTWPLAFGLYLLGLLVTAVRPDRGHISASAFFLSGLGVGFYALGITRQPGLWALPVGTVVLWSVAVVAYRESQVRAEEGP